MDTLMDCALKSGVVLIAQVARLFQALNTGDGAHLGNMIAEDVTLRYEGGTGTVPFAGTYTGAAGVKDFGNIFYDLLLIENVDLRYFLRQGNILHMHLTEEGIVRPTGKKYVMETVQCLEFDDTGKIKKLRWYNDTFALYNAFKAEADPKLSLAQHPADYGIVCQSRIDPLPIVKRFYRDFSKRSIQTIATNVSDDAIFILAGPEGHTKMAGTWVGPQKVESFLTTVFEHERYNFFRPITFTTQGHRVDVEFEEEIVILDTGRVAHCAGLHSLGLNSLGHIVTFRSYNDSYACAWGYGNGRSPHPGDARP